MKDDNCRQRCIDDIICAMQSAENYDQVGDSEEFNRAWEHAFASAKGRLMQERYFERKHPWISDRTLQYMAERTWTHSIGNQEDEKW